MADNDPLTVAGKVVVKNDTKAGAEAAAEDVKKMSEVVSSELGRSTRAAGDSMARFSDVLRDHRREEVQTGRQIAFFTRQIEEFTGKGNESAAMLGTLAGAFAMGGVFEVGMELAKVGVVKLVEVMRELDQIERVNCDTTKTYSNLIKVFAEDMAKARKSTADLAEQFASMGIDPIVVKMQDAQKRLWEIQQLEDKLGPGQEADIARRAKQIEATEKKIAAEKQWQAIKPGASDTSDIEKEERRLELMRLEQKASVDGLAARRAEADALRENLAILQDMAKAKKQDAEAPRVEKESEDARKAEFAQRLREMSAYYKALEDAAAQEKALAERREASVLKWDQKLQAGRRSIAEDNLALLTEIDRKQTEEAKKEADRRTAIAQRAGSLIADASYQFGYLMVTNQKDVGRQLAVLILRQARLAVQAYMVQAMAATAATSAGLGPFGWAAALAGVGVVGGVFEGFLSQMPSAAHGFDIPRGVNPMTQLHEREMVLPADIAEPLRQSLAGGGGVGLNVTINAIDGASVRRMVESHDFARAIQEARRNGARI